MLYEATLETFEEASLRVQRTLTSLKELTHRKDIYTKNLLDGFASHSTNEEDTKEHLLRMYDVEREIERELRELAVFLDIQAEDIGEDMGSFKEMVSKAAVRTKLENISYFTNTGMYPRGSDREECGPEDEGET